MLSDRLYGMFFIVIGLITGYISIDYGIYSSIGPAPGTFPLIISILFIFFSIPLVFSGRDVLAVSKADFPPVSSIASNLAIVLISVGYAITLPYLGVGLTSFVALASIALILHRGSRMIVMAIAIAGGTAMEIIFWYLLGVYLPATTRLFSTYFG